MAPRRRGSKETTVPIESGMDENGEPLHKKLTKICNRKQKFQKADTHYFNEEPTLEVIVPKKPEPRVPKTSIYITKTRKNKHGPPTVVTRKVFHTIKN